VTGEKGCVSTNFCQRKGWNCCYESKCNAWSSHSASFLHHHHHVPNATTLQNWQSDCDFMFLM